MKEYLFNDIKRWCCPGREKDYSAYFQSYLNADISGDNEEDDEVFQFGNFFMKIEKCG